MIKKILFLVFFTIPHTHPGTYVDLLDAIYNDTAKLKDKRKDLSVPFDRRNGSYFLMGAIGTIASLLHIARNYSENNAQDDFAFNLQGGFIFTMLLLGTILDRPARKKNKPLLDEVTKRIEFNQRKLDAIKKNHIDTASLSHLLEIEKNKESLSNQIDHVEYSIAPTVNTINDLYYQTTLQYRLEKDLKAFDKQIGYFDPLRGMNNVNLAMYSSFLAFLNPLLLPTLLVTVPVSIVVCLTEVAMSPFIALRSTIQHAFDYNESIHKEISDQEKKIEQGTKTIKEIKEKLSILDEDTKKLLKE